MYYLNVCLYFYYYGKNKCLVDVYSNDVDVDVGLIEFVWDIDI